MGQVTAIVLHLSDSNYVTAIMREKSFPEDHV